MKSGVSVPRPGLTPGTTLLSATCTLLRKAEFSKYFSQVRTTINIKAFILGIFPADTVTTVVFRLYIIVRDAKNIISSFKFLTVRDG